MQDSRRGSIVRSELSSCHPRSILGLSSVIKMSLYIHVGEKICRHFLMQVICRASAKSALFFHSQIEKSKMDKNKCPISENGFTNLKKNADFSDSLHSCRQLLKKKCRLCSPYIKLMRPEKTRNGNLWSKNDRKFIKNGLVMS